ncbi:MAG: MFS transporter [Gammaproteobacteria bacterium]|nr:MFS transporter [Gammaproteobacteria bacterium]
MLLSEYWQFVRRNRRLAAFGFLITLCSSFGQTFFIGVFGPHVQADLGLTHTEWSGVYMLGTLASAAALPFTGKFIDQLSLRRYTLLVGIGLGIACVCMAGSTAVWSAVLAIFLLRQCGQGLMTHVSMTTMARYFDAARGRAIAVATLGFPTGEALLPILTVALIGALGWRMAYASYALLLLFALLPLALWLLGGQALPIERRAAHAASTGLPEVTPSGVESTPQRDWNRAEVMRDRAFWIMLPGVLAPSIIVTALFFHHLNIADIKGWSAQWITGCYLVYSIASVLTMLSMGPLCDRFGARRLFPHSLWPLAAGTLLLSLADAAWLVVPYLALLGISTGMGQTSGAAIWAELYGVRHLGAVRSLVIALRVFASALGPIIPGTLLDRGVGLDPILALLGLIGVLGGCCLLLGVWRASGRRERYSIRPPGSG